MRTPRAFFPALALLLLVACSSTVTDEPDTPSADASPSAADDTEAASVGDAITLADIAGNEVAVTVQKVFDPATKGQYQTTCAKGDRLVGVLISLKPLDASYTDSPENGARLIDTGNQQHDACLTEITEAETFGGSAKISAGNEAVGAIVFSIPKSATTKMFQFTLDRASAPRPANGVCAG